MRVLFNLSGSIEQPVRNITLQGLSLRDTRYTYLDAHGMPSGGDWALQRSGAIFLEGTEGVIIRDNELTNLDGIGISINGYHRSLTVDHNDFSWIGDSAMAAWGHTGYCLNEVRANSCREGLEDVACSAFGAGARRRELSQMGPG